jgi:hypothetical protein
MIHSITSSPHSNFLRLLQLLLLMLCQKSHFDVVNFVVKLTILHRKMIPRGQLLLYKHLEICRFDHEIVAGTLNCSSICIMLAITVCDNGGSVIVIKILLKWRDLLSKHDTSNLLLILILLWLLYNKHVPSINFKNSDQNSIEVLYQKQK